MRFEDSPFAALPRTAGLLSGARARAELGFAPDFPGVTGIADYLAHLRRLAPAEPM